MTFIYRVHCQCMLCLGRELVCNLGDTRSEYLIYILIAQRKGPMRYIINGSNVP